MRTEYLAPPKWALRVVLPLALAAALAALVLGLVAALGVGDLIRVTTASDSNRDSRFPSMSADGTKVAFRSDSDLLGQGIPDNQNEIWLYDTTTMTLTRVTAASDNFRDSDSPSLSADGTKVAFRSDSDFLGQGIPDNQNEIWLYDTTTMTLTRVTTISDNFRDSDSPSLSADGTKVAFRSDSDFLGQGVPDGQFEIWLYDTAAMTLTRVTSASAIDRDSLNPSLNADGTKVAFQSNSDFLGQGIPNQQFEIWLYDTTAMTLTRVTSASAIDQDSIFPSLSADGTKVAFQSNSDFLGQGIPNSHRYSDEDLRYEIWLYDTTTMTFILATAASDSFRSSDSPSLSADGTKVAFRSDSDFRSGSDFQGQSIPNDQHEIWLYNTTTMTLTRVTAASDSNRDSLDPSLSADGTKVAFLSDSDFLGQGIADEQFEIWLKRVGYQVFLPVVLK